MKVTRHFESGRNSTGWIILFLALFIPLITCKPEYTEGWNDKAVPVLCYHSVNPKMNNLINTRPDVFEGQIKFLKENGYTSILSNDLMEIKKLKNSHKNFKPVIITFDDGRSSVYKWALPIMKKYGYKGLVFLITKTLVNKPRNGFLKIDEINDLIKEGWEIGSHTFYHYYRKKDSRQRIDDDYKNSMEFLEKTFKIEVKSVAYPRGIINEKIIEAAGKHYQFAYSIIEGNNEDFNNLMIRRNMILKSTSLDDIKSILKTKTLNIDLMAMREKRKLAAILDIPEYISIKDVKIYGNYNQSDTFTIKENRIKFKFKKTQKYNFISVYVTDTDNNIYCISKMIDVTGGRISVF
jgi:peptidoglycan/xylan/chitin deacetylase (PgdA/CDA1 family)